MDLQEILSLPDLWDHQKASIIHCVKYIEGFNPKASGAALNRLPTGTGKSGIIAILSRCLDDVSNVLVLTPSEALREQLLEDIKSVFVEKMGIQDKVEEKKCIAFLPSTIQDLLEDNRKMPIVLVGTIQALFEIYSANRKQYDRLKDIISLAVFDEGHREPAPEWGTAVRALRKPTILFTATPYRNDRQKFAVEDTAVYGFSHADALKGRYIRGVQFMEFSGTQDPLIFANRLVAFYRNQLPKVKPQYIDKPRVIVRCGNFSEIITIAEELAKEGFPTLAVHDRFSGELTSALKQKGNKAIYSERVINVKRETERFKDNPQELRRFFEELPVFWVHQFKLLEGIDESSFCVVANFAPMSNARMLIQQVGRVLRNPGRKESNEALFIYQQGSPDYAFWKGYLKYEEQYENQAMMDTLYFQDMFDSVAAVLPAFHYEGRTFKKRFQWYQIEDEEGNLTFDPKYKFYEHTKFKLSATIYHHSESRSIKAIADEIRLEYTKNEYDIRLPEPEYIDRFTFFIPFFRVNDSPLLSDTYFLNFSYGYVIGRIKKGYLFFYDSSGGRSEYVANNFSLLRADELNKLFVQGIASLQQITLRSTEINNYIPRSIVNTSVSLEDTAGDLVDFLQFYSRVKGRTNAFPNFHSAQSAVGFSRSRITEQTTKSFTALEYIQWTNEVGELLSNTENEPISLFERFAEFVGPPDKISPQNILIDFDDIKGSFVHKETESGLQMPNTCFDVKAGVFKLQILLDNGEEIPYDVQIDYEEETKLCKVECNDLRHDFKYHDEFGTEKKDESIVRYLNREQCFRIIPEDSEIIYAHRHFYKPRLPILNKAKKNKVELLNVFVPIKELSSADSEKGKTIAKGRWEKGCVFHYIDTLGKGTELHKYLGGLEYLLCDDAGDTEIADFIGLQMNPARIVMMHAKAFKDPKVRSASALQEVCAQAVKNLSYLITTNQQRPPNYPWSRPYKAADVTGSLNRVRYPKTNCTGVEFWKKYIELLRNPATQKQVYILLGQGFDLQKFKENIDSRKPDPANVQIVYQVQSTYSNVMKIATDFKIFCSLSEPT